MIRPSKDVMSRISEAFEALLAPYYRSSSNVTRGSRCGPNPWQQHHHKARDALRSAAKGERTFTSFWNGWKHDEIFSEMSTLTQMVGRMGQVLGSHRAVRHTPQRTAMAEKGMWTWFIYEVLTRTNRRDHHGRDKGTRKQKRELANLQKSKGLMQVLYIPASVRKRQNNKLDFSLREYLEWLSLHCADIFAEQHDSECQQPSSSSRSFFSWNRSWLVWHSHEWQDDKLSDQW